ncbi:MAG TPA: alpha/beta fold hydrolase [Casimicrobiaceae bacterium]|nr:alpha/beta fold hydrolase [Casimicrobiaceae bacterium]
MPEHESTTEIDERPVTLTTDDGVALSGQWSTPRGQAAPSMAVIVACGAGIPARFYSRLARHVAARGAAILTFDYRGIGASRRGSLRRLSSGMDDWAVRDLGAAIAEARRSHSNVPLGAIAHSVGAMLLGAATGADAIARSVFLGAHTGYWRDYNARWRLPLFVVWHALMPAVTHAVGYFPGSTFRLGEDLPRGVALDWARRRRPALIRTARDEARFGPYVERYAAFRAATLSISISDDAFAPPAAAERLLAMYPALDARRETVTPGDAGVHKLGHFGFIRRPAGEYFWNRSADWLLLASA